LVTKSADALTVRTIVRLTHVIPLASIHAAYFVPRYVHAKNPRAARLVLRDDEHRLLLRLDSATWNREEIAALAAELPDVIQLPDNLTAKELIRQYPQVAGFAERHPWRAWTIFAAGVLVFLIAFGLAVSTLPA
jgi:hypothetical protein